MVDRPTPKTVKEVRGFLGLAGYYRRFIKDYEKIDKPLTELLKKDKFTWNEMASTAFQELKEAMTTTHVLVLPNFNLEFIIETDACGIGIGEKLMQEGHPLAFMSKSLSSRHQQLSVCEKEMMAIVAAAQKWRYYLFGKIFHYQD